MVTLKYLAINTYIDKRQREKLDKAIEGTFVGHDNRSKGYRICIRNNRTIQATIVKFIENCNSNKITRTIDMKNEINVQNSQIKQGWNLSYIFINMQEDKRVQKDREKSIINEPKRSQR